MAAPVDPQQLAIDIEPDAAEPDSYRLIMRGEIDMASAPQLTDALDAVIDKGARTVVLDARGIGFLDSSGLRVIINGRNRMVTVGGTLTISGMSGAVQRVLDVSGLLEQYRDGQPDRATPSS